MPIDPATGDTIVTFGREGDPSAAPDQPVGWATPQQQQQPQQPAPGILDRMWKSVADVGREFVNPTPATETPSVGGRALGEGLVRGVADVFDTVSKPALQAFGADQSLANMEGRRQAFEKDYSDSSAASLGRVAGQTLASTPMVSTAGSWLGAGARMIPGALGDAIKTLTGLMPASGTIGRTAQLAGQGAAAGAASAALTDGDIGSGAVIGGLAGPVAGGIGRALDVLSGRAGGLSPDVAQLAQTALGYNVPTDLSRLSQNPTMRIVADQMAKLPFSGAAGADLGARRAVQRVLAEQMGEDADRFGPQVMKNAATRIGGVFNDVADRTTIQGGEPLRDKLVSIAREIPTYGLTEAQKKPLQAQFQNVLGAFRDGGGRITGKTYQNLTQTGGPLDSVISSDDPAVSAFGMKIRNALDDAFERSATAEDTAALKQAREQYRVMKTIEPLAAESTTGDISMGKLLSRVNAQSQRFDPSTGSVAYTGGGALGDMGRIGKQFLAAQPESGTAPRMAAWQAMQHPIGTLAASPWLGMNAALQAYLRAPGVSRRLIESSLPGATPANVGRYVPGVVPGVVSGTQGLFGF